MMVKNTYPLPLVPDIINRILDSKARYFMKLDIHWGYNNVQIKEGDEWKAAFQMNWGLFEPLVMFFSLTNSPVTFQTMMNNICKDLIDEGYVAVYMDDILVYTRMIEHHQEVVTRVLDVLQTHQLYLKVEKCTFECTTVEYLGLILSEGWVEMDPVKIAGVRDWPTPKNITEVQSFVGFVNFYHRFIPEFSHVAGPLHCLTNRAEPWRWTEPEEAAF